MPWQARDVLWLVFVALLMTLVVAGRTTAAHPRNEREWSLVRALLVFLMWALIGVGWLRSR